MLSEEQKQKRRESRRKWRQKNPNYTKQYKLEHAERCQQMGSDYRIAHKDQKREYDKLYRQNNAEQIAERKRSYHAHRSSSHKRVYDDQVGVWECSLCGAVEGEIQLDIHHKNQDKTDNRPENLVCLCKTCHQLLHQKWSNQVIPSLIESGIVDWDGNIINK